MSNNSYNRTSPKLPKRDYTPQVGLVLKGHSINLIGFTENNLSAFRSAIRKELKDRNITNKKLKLVPLFLPGDYTAKLVPMETL